MGTLKIENGTISANTFIGNLSGTADYSRYIIDSFDGATLRISYGTDSMRSPSYLAAWDGRTLKSIKSERLMGAFYVSEESDTNNLLTSGNYRLGATVSNAPTYCGYGQLLALRGYKSDTIAQLIFPYNSQAMYFRNGTTTNVVNQSWSTVLTNKNFTEHLNSRYLSLSGGTTSGSLWASTTSGSEIDFGVENTGGKLYLWMTSTGGGLWSNKGGTVISVTSDGQKKFNTTNYGSSLPSSGDAGEMFFKLV